MKKINITYIIGGIVLVCIFIYCVLQKQCRVQSCGKKVEIISTENQVLEPTIVELPITIIEPEEINKNPSQTRKTLSVFKISVHRSKKDIRKRMHRKYEQLHSVIAENKQQKSNERPFSNKCIAVTNNITNEMLMYHHWTGNHAPTTFVVSVDGVPVKEGESVDVFYDENNEIVIRYDYSFLKGYKTGSREIYFEPRKTKNQAHSLTFSWQHPMHLLLENAETKKGVVVDFNKLLEN